MAVRPQSLHDGSVVERRLRPIYDWLDNGNNKKALQEAEKVLKKSPTLQAARALRCLALLRLGRSEEAMSALDTLSAEHPSDDTTLQAITIIYRESQQLHKVCALYEAAVKVEPTSEELHSHLFMSYVRVGDYLSQQRSAMALYKFAPKNPYYFWAVMSIVLQAENTQDTIKKNILLSLAQRMVDNFIADNKMEAEQEARLYIMILERQEKWKDILKFIESPLYRNLVAGSVAQASIVYLKKLKNWKRLNIVCKELLYDNPDRWDYYLPYFDSVMALIKEGNEEAGVDDTVEKCHEFLCQLVEGSGRGGRGPLLARLELRRRLDGGAELGSASALCLQYLRAFAHKPCAAPDLRPFLDIIPKEERERCARDFLTCLGFDEYSQPETPEDIQRHISCLQTWRWTAPPPGAGEALALARALQAQYLRHTPAPRTEPSPADAYALMAAQLYFSAGLSQRSSRGVVQCARLLVSRGCARACPRARLLLLHACRLLGAAPAAAYQHQQLDLKHVQLVTLGWVLAGGAPGPLVPAAAARLLTATAAFADHNHKDSAEQLTLAYKYGTFEKLSELRAWGARLRAGAWPARAQAERGLLALACAAPAPARARAPPAPTDTRDLTVLGMRPDEEYIQRTFKQEVALMHIRVALLRAVMAAGDIASGDREEKLKELKEMVVELRGAYAKGDAVVYNEELRIDGPLPSRVIAMVSSPYRELYPLSLELVHSCYSGSEPPTGLAERLGKVTPSIPEGDVLWHMRDALYEVSDLLEFLGIGSHLAGICHEAGGNTKRGKKKTTPQLPALASFINALLESASKLDTILNSWPTLEGLPEDIDGLNLDGQPCEFNKKLAEGMKEMIGEAKNAIKKHTKFLKMLCH